MDCDNIQIPLYTLLNDLVVVTRLAFPLVISVCYGSSLNKSLANEMAFKTQVQRIQHVYYEAAPFPGNVIRCLSIGCEYSDFAKKLSY